MGRSQRHKVDVQHSDTRGGVLAQGEVFEPSGFLVNPSQIGGLIDNPLMDGVHVSIGPSGGPLSGSSTSGAIPDGAIGPTPEKPPLNTMLPSITGLAVVGQLLTASPGSWQGYPVPTYAYQWQRSPNGISGWADVSGATNSTYTVHEDDTANYLRVFVTATNSEGVSTASSTPTSLVAPVASAPTNTIAPAITGVPVIGSVMVSTPGTWVGYPAPMITYQWQRSDDGSTGWANIAGANGNTYALQGADIGKYVRSTVTATNIAGNASASSLASLQVAGISPTNVVAPSITGAATVGQVLNAVVGSWTGNPAPTFGYQWQSSPNGVDTWANISGATASAYTVHIDDQNKYIRVIVTGTNVSGSDSANSSSTSQVGASVSPPVNEVVPSITGTEQAGQLLTGHIGTWSGNPTPTYAFKWQRSANGVSGWADIFGATASTYTLQAADYQQYVRFVVIATNNQGTVSENSLPTEQIAGTAPTNSVIPSFTGTPVSGSVLSGQTGTWGGVPSPTYTYQWQRSDDGSTGWANISGATSINYTLQPADNDKYVRLRVTGTNVISGVTANSNASAKIGGFAPVNTSVPVITGTLTAGQTLTASSGTWNGVPTPTYTYQWQRSANGVSGWANISGATASTYALVSADAFQYVRVVVTGTNTSGSAQANSVSTAQIAGVAPTNSLAPSFTGSTTVGSVLSGAVGTWSGIPTPTYGYQWQRSDDGSTGWANISGANAINYTLHINDYDKYVRLRVTGTNGQGSASAESVASAQIAASNMNFDDDPMTFDGDQMFFYAA